MRENDWRPDLADPATRRQLEPRIPPYFNLLQYCRHIGLRVRSRDTAFWVARVRKRDGGYKQYVVGEEQVQGEAVMSFDSAVEAASKWFASPDVRAVSAEPYQLGSKRELSICPIGATYTVGHALEDYLAWKLLAATRSHYETLVSLINYHIVPRLSGLALEEFNGKHFQIFAKSVLEAPPKKNRRDPMGRTPVQELSSEALRKRKKTLNALVSILRGAFEIAWEHGRIDSDRPMRCLRRVPNVDRPRVVFLDRSECHRLLKACESDLEALVTAALYTGCRANELTQMAVGDVNLNHCSIFVASPKGQRTRQVMLPPEGRDFFGALAAGRSSSERLFLKANGRAWGGEYKTYFQKARNAACLPNNLTFHGLRHTYASQLIQAGASLLAVAEQLGHANTHTVSTTYGHLSPRHLSREITQHFEPLFAEVATTGSTAIRPPGRGFKDNGHVPDRFVDWPRSNFSKLNGPLIKELRGPRS